MLIVCASCFVVAEKYICRCRHIDLSRACGAPKNQVYSQLFIAHDLSRTIKTTIMTLNELKERFDHPGSIVLLEGKRKVAPEDQPKLIAIGKLLAEQTKHIVFRSGNAAGSDQFFSEGVAAVDKTRLEVITPYAGHRKTTNKAYRTHALDELNIASEPEVIYHSKSHKKMAGLVDRYIAGDKGHYAIKAAYILRDTVKVLGTKDIPPATFAIFYDDLNDPIQGGTGHTMRVCDDHNVPRIDQGVWMGFLGA